MAKPRTRFDIQVTERDISRAERNNSFECVVSQAIARSIPDATRIETDIQSIRFTRQETGERLIYLTPHAVQGYVVAFDAGERPEPFSFRLGNPIPGRRLVRTEAGKRAASAANKARRAAAKALASDDSLSDEARQKQIHEAAHKAWVKVKGSEPSRKGDDGRRIPLVSKRRVRQYGHRVLRINQIPDS